MNLKIYYSENLKTDVTTTLNLHNALELSKSNYSRSLKIWLSDVYGFNGEIRVPKQGLDYSSYMTSENTGQGNFAKDYEITIELAKLITLNSRSLVKQRYAQWLLELERKLNNLELLTIEQAIFIQKLIELFRYISNQKLILKEHSKKYVSERINKGKNEHELYSFFHNWRNSTLDISPNEVNDRIKQFCIDNQKSISLSSKNVSKFDKIFTMDNYETLKHAVWDYLQTKNRPDVALKVAEMTYQIAKNSEVELFTNNENNLFQRKTNPNLKLE